MNMENIFIPRQYSLKFKVFRIAIVIALLLAFEIPIGAPKAEANLLAETYLTMSDFVATTVGYDLCSYPCAAVGAFASHAINTYAPVIANSAVAYVKPGLIEMFTDWGASFFRY